MGSRKIMLIGAAIVVGGVVLQQLITAIAGAISWGLRGPDLYQSVIGFVVWFVQIIGSVSIPLGAAVLGGGLVLWLRGRRAASPSAQQPEHDRLD